MQSDLELSPIGNCQVSTLVDSEGAFVWGCVPRVDGDPVFCSLLNDNARDRGIWRFELEGQARSSQRYERNTAILVTRLEAEDGSAVEIHDFAPRFERSGRMYRPVAYARIVRPVAGAPRLRIVLAPMNGYGASLAETTNGTNHIRYMIGPQALRLSLALNGETVQDSDTSDMIFGVAEIISYMSRFMALVPGDLIATGTPSGVGLGMTPPRFLRAGDVMELSVEGLGTQRQEVVAG